MWENSIRTCVTCVLTLNTVSTSMTGPILQKFNFIKFLNRKRYLDSLDTNSTHSNGKREKKNF